MIAEDTVMTDLQIEALKREAEKSLWTHKAHPRFEAEKYLLLAQAEITWKAAIKEVVDWIIVHKMAYHTKSDEMLIAVTSAEWTEEEWQDLRRIEK